MADQATAKSKREQFGERLRAKYPEKEYADDEELFGQINDDYDAYDNEIGQYKEREGVFSDLLAKNPYSAQFISDMAHGKNPWIGVVEKLGIDGVMAMLNDPEKQEEIAEAQKQYVERLAKNQELEEQYAANLEESLQMLQAMQQERGLSDDEINAAWNLIQSMTTDAIVGKVSRETVEMALKALNHDSAVEEARNEGEISGRNARIEERLRKRKAGDGLPAVGGANSGAARQAAQQHVGVFADLHSDDED